MPICKIQINENGSIFGVQKIEAVDDAFWVDGIMVDESFYQGVATDLEQAIATWCFDFQAETFVLRPEITAEPVKLELNIASGDSLIIPGLPVPCTIKVDGQEFTMIDPEDTTFELLIDFPGIYSVSVEAWPHQDKSWEVTVI